MTQSAGGPSFAQLLRRYRRAAGLTQEGLAARAGISARAVSDLERADARVPRRETLELLIAALGLAAGDRAAIEATISRIRSEPRAREQGTTPPEKATRREPFDGLPEQLTPFIGREREIVTALEWLLEPGTRLLTLTGPGGVGKTRMAVQVAAAARAQFADGVVFVPFASISDPELVLPTVARVLKVAEVPDQTIGEVLAADLRDKRLLLVLDNFEQIIPAATGIMDLLAAVPGIKALVTSRAALRTRGEQIYQVPPLTVPMQPLQLMETLAQFEAVRLFVARAQDVQRGFVLGDETAATVAEICARLDGLPLAIELAAARTRLLSPKALLNRLNDRLRVVAGGAQDLPDRHRTLRATLDWSYSLLDPGERTLFTRLAVFVGGHILEAAEAVCDADGTLSLDVLDGVESLLDKSLLQREQGVEGEPRLTMLETIHAYAREQLDASGERQTLEREHATYYASLAERAEPELRGPTQAQWLDRLQAEHDNIRATLRWATGQAGDAALGLRVAASIWRFWYVRGFVREGQGWLGTLLGRQVGTPAIRAAALHAAGNLAWAMGEGEHALVLYQESLPLRRSLGDAIGTARLLGNMGVVATEQGDLPRTQALQEEALALHRAEHDTQGVATTLINLGNTMHHQRAFAEAQILYKEAMTLWHQAGDTRGIALALGNLGVVMEDQGDFDRADELLNECLALHRTLGNTGGIASTLGALGAVALARSDHAHAEALLMESLGLWRDLGVPQAMAECLGYLASIAAALGQTTRATCLARVVTRMYADAKGPLTPLQQDEYDRMIAAVRTVSSGSAIPPLQELAAAERWEGVVRDELAAYAGRRSPN